MRLISLICFFIVISAHSVDIALPIKANNPDCQIELTEREDFWSTTHKRMMLDFEITLHLGSLFDLRATAIGQGNGTLIQQIDSKIYDSLRYVLHRPEFLDPFRKHLSWIKESLELQPLHIGSEELQQIRDGFAVLGL
jgi:hypothetical protein